MKLLILFGLILIGFAIYTFFTSGAVSTKQSIHQPVIQQQEQEQQVVETVIKNTVVPERVITQHNEPSNYDTNTMQQKEAGTMDEMRHPEYMFRPAPDNNNTNIAAESGSAAMISQMQQYRPDFVQNGGEFMDNVIPASSMDDTGFSTFN